MNRIKVAAAAAALTGSAAFGAYATMSVMTAGAATPADVQNAGFVTVAAPASPGASPGTFKSNEDATHEGGESAAREAAEDSGTAAPGGHAGVRPGGGSNEDPTHEGTESPQREAAEGGAAASPSPTPTPAQ